MELLTIKEVSAKWNISSRRLTALCKQGRIKGAVKIAGVWILPPDCEKPSDARIKSGRYTNWRKSADMTSVDFSENIRNLEGTFSVENMEISSEMRSNLKRLFAGDATYNEIIDQIKQKYKQKV